MPLAARGFAATPPIAAAVAAATPAMLMLALIADYATFDACIISSRQFSLRDTPCFCRMPFPPLLTLALPYAHAISFFMPLLPLPCWLPFFAAATGRHFADAAAFRVFHAADEPRFRG